MPPQLVSAAEFLTHMAEASGLPPSMARTRAADTLRHAGLFEERYRAIGGYSTGMKQRVKLCQALVHDPAFVFLDEPTAGLDPAGREEMLTLIRKTHREFGISVLFSSHLMADVERTCDRIIVLQGGQLVHSGEVAQFTKETETVFIEVDTQPRGSRRRARAARRRRDAERSGLTIEGPDQSVYDHVRDALVESQRSAPANGAAPARAHRAVRARRRRDRYDGNRFRHRVSAYTGRREGRSRSRNAIYKDGLRTALGLGRGARAKILPWFFISVLSAIALVMALIAGAADRIGGPGRRCEGSIFRSHSDLQRHRVDHHVRVRGGRRAGAAVSATGATA